MRDLENKQMESKLRDSGEDKSRGVDLSREVLQVFAISSELEQNERRGDDSRQRRVRPETLERDWNRFERVIKRGQTCYHGLRRNVINFGYVVKLEIDNVIGR